jgi:hypothetical protein
MYEDKNAPVRVALEMRLTGGSDVLLAPQRGNTNGTVSIEVLTHVETPKDYWQHFLQQIADKWTSYTDREGKVLVARPHWAKEWSDLTVNKMPIEEYMRQVAYKEAFVQFRAVYQSIVEKRKSTVKDTLKVFGNDLMMRLVFPEYS